MSYCNDCKRETYTILDYSSGDCVCTECGLVLEERYIDERPEWRNFADDGTGGHDHTRVGEALDPLLTSLSTTITKTRGSEEAASAMSKLQSRVSDIDRGLIEDFATIEFMSEKLQLVRTIKDRAKEIFKHFKDAKSLKGRNKVSMIAACVFQACKENNPRTINEILEVNQGLIKKDLGKSINFLNKNMNSEERQACAVTAADFLKRFCQNLEMDRNVTKACLQIAEMVQQILDVRRSPVSVAAAILYMVTILKRLPNSLRDVAAASGVSESTIRMAYGDIQPHASRIVPQGFVDPEAFRRL